MGNKKYIIVIVAVLVVLVAVLASFQSQSREAGGLKVGAVLPLTGPGSFFGEEMQNGMKLCNDEGLNVIYSDSQTNPSEGVTAFRKLTETDKIDLGVVSFSSVADSVVPIAKRKKTPLLLSVVSASDVAKDGGKFVSRYFTSGGQEAPIMANFAYDDLGKRKAAVIYMNSAYGKSYKNAFTSAFEEKGGEVVSAEAFKSGDKDFSAQLTKIKSADPDSLYVIGLPKNIISILKQSKELRLDATILGNWIYASPGIREGNNELFNGTYFTTPSYYFSNSSRIYNFKQSYESEFGRPPSSYAAIGCDIVNMVSEKEGKDGMTTMNNLKSLNGYKGIMGRLSSDKNGEIDFKLYPAKLEGSELKVLK